MQHHALSRFASAALAGMLATATTVATAAGPRDISSPPRVDNHFTKLINKHLVSTSVEGDSVHYDLNPGFTSIGSPITFSCAAACTIIVQAMVQVEQQNPYWAICPTIDGNDAVQGCNWTGVQSSPSGLYVTGNGTYFWSLAAGTHKFQGQVYFSIAGGLDNWAMTIAEYK